MFHPPFRELRIRADAGFGFNPVFVALEARPAQYAVVARLTPALKRLLPGISYEPVNQKWEMAEFEHRPHDWPHARRFVVARSFIQREEAETTLFSMGRYIYRAWVPNPPLTPAGIWHFYDGRAGMEPLIRELREDFALRKIPTASFAANALSIWRSSASRTIWSLHFSETVWMNPGRTSHFRSSAISGFSFPAN
jgi:hypothetical protein